MSTIETLRRSDGPPEANTPKAPENDPSATDQQLPPTLVIWAVRLGALGLLGSIVLYLVQLIVTPDIPAQFRFDVDWPSVENRRGNYVLPIEVINDSTTAVNTVVVRATLDLGGGEEEVNEYTIPMMGEGEIADAEILFSERPSENRLELRVLSYQSP